MINERPFKIYSFYKTRTVECLFVTFESCWKKMLLVLSDSTVVTHLIHLIRYSEFFL